MDEAENDRKAQEILDEAVRKLFELDGEGFAVGYTIVIDYLMPGDPPSDSRSRIMMPAGQLATTTIGQLVTAQKFLERKITES